jgi:erythromycin esterase
MTQLLKRMRPAPFTTFTLFILVAFATSVLFSTLSRAAPAIVQAAGSTDANDITNELRQAALPLNGVEAGRGFDDLEPLRARLEGVRIVGLGEATHGTREFFQFKHRTVEFLARELGFTLFILEGSYAGVGPLNDYVLGRAGPADVTAQMARSLAVIWNTEEVREMLNWMRDYNRAQPEARKLRFLGFDPQLAAPSAEALLAYLRRVAPSQVARARKAMRHLTPVTHEWAYETFPSRPLAERKAARRQLMEFASWLAGQHRRLIAASSEAQYRDAMQWVQLLLQSDEIRNFSGDARENHMADNIDYLLDRAGPGARAILWAHNFHLSRVAEGFRPWESETDFRPMGSFLARRHGAAYYAIGFAFDHGAFQAGDEDAEREAESAGAFGGMREFTLPPSPVNELGARLSLAGPLYLLDLRGATTRGAMADWLNTPQPMRWIGAEFSRKWPAGNYTTPVMLRDHFDALFFVRETTRARPLPYDAGVRPYRG